MMDRVLKLVIESKLSYLKIRICGKHHNIMGTDIFVAYFQLGNV
jgi:hypothetical protein